ncbi:MAG TPA: radical SAM protein [Candidatus Cloacimonadota bacterium]|nr:radical SAM protein [Candidatus Cloacimonadota bacterium]
MEMTNRLSFTDYKHCLLCPRECGIDRTENKKGFCGETAQLRIASMGAHFGEEPPISGRNGSGTVFFSGCSLKCCYCQNYQISFQGLGKTYTCQQVADELLKLAVEKGIHNVNFVTPDHFFPHAVKIVELLRADNFSLPILFNMSGYQKLESIQSLKNYADIYLPDYKYADAKLAKALSSAEDYPEIALMALSEMIKQKGFLDSFVADKEIANRGVLVRHLLLPGQVQNSQDVLTTLFLEFGRDIPISLMSQYYPPDEIIASAAFQKSDFLQRTATISEFEEVYEHALKLGLNNLFVQFPEDFSSTEANTDFMPDFNRDKPFNK